MVVVSVPPCGGIRLRGGLVSVRGGLLAGLCELLMSQGGKWSKPLSGGGRDPARRRVGMGWWDGWDVYVQGGVRGLVGVIEHAPASFEEANLRCMTARTTFLRDIAAHVTWVSTVSGGFL